MNSYRKLMRADSSNPLQFFSPPSPDLIREGLPYWIAADRFRHTPYGEALKNDIEDLQGALN